MEFGVGKTWAPVSVFPSVWVSRVQEGSVSGGAVSPRPQGQDGCQAPGASWCENSWRSLVPTEHLGSGKGGDGAKWRRLKAFPVQK